MITKEQFENAYIKHPPTFYELFYLKNISISSLYIKPLPIILFSLGLIAPFIFALIGHMLKWPLICTYIPNFIYAGILAVVGTYGLLIWTKRRKRIHSICKYLKITDEEYQEIVHKYYYENYYPDIKDYIYSICK